MGEYVTHVFAVNTGSDWPRSTYATAEHTPLFHVRKCTRGSGVLKCHCGSNYDDGEASKPWNVRVYACVYACVCVCVCVSACAWVRGFVGLHI